MRSAEAATVAFGAAGLMGLVATPVAIRVATARQFLDRPVRYKAHLNPTPYLGGAAVVTAFLLAVALAHEPVAELAALAGGVILLWIVGTVDDRQGMSPSLRVIAEIAAAVGVVTGGLGFSVFTSDFLNALLSIAWVVGVVNAFNLMDNIDGAAATVGAVSCAAIGFLALVHSDTLIAVLAFAASGSCLGFLPYNLAGPARIFLGDGGSMPVGFIVAVSAMALHLGGGADLSPIAVATLLVALPILDTTLVVISRLRRGTALLTGVRDHLTHRLLLRLRSPRAVALALAVGQAALGGLAIAAFELGDTTLLLTWMGALAAGAVAIVILERPPWAPGPDAAPRRFREIVVARQGAGLAPESLD